MNTQRERQLKDSFDSYIQLVLFDLSIDKISEIVAEDVTGYGTTVDEKILEINRFRKVVTDQREQGKGIDIRVQMMPIHRRISPDKDTAIFMDEFEISMVIDGTTNVIPLRLTSVFEFNGKTWKLIHLHSSKAVETEGDTWHQDEWKRKNEELEKLVDEKTADLLLKNKELEIEAALEKVRAIALSMKKPADMLAVCRILSKQLQSLGIRDIRNVQTAVINDTKGTYLNYQYFTAYDESTIEETAYNKHPKVLEMVNKMRQSVDAFFFINLEGRELEKFGQYRKEDHQFSDPLLDGSISLHFYFYAIGGGWLGLSTYKPLPDADLDIFQRFHKAFGLAYRRFIDIEKAEAQAREAKIEIALERVRAKSMSMHNTSELQEVVNIVAQQLHNMEMDITGVFLSINNEINDNEFTFWGSSGVAENYAKRTSIPFLDRPIYTVLEEFVKKRKGFFVEEYTKEEKIEFFKHLFKHPPYNSSTPEWKNEVLSREGGYTRSVSVSQYTTIFVVNHHGRPLSDAENEILKRFGNVFDQSYVRFLDLQKAEKQYREAQIEASLERIRAKAMAMQHTDELNDVIGLLCEQYDVLGINPVCAHLSLIDLENDRFSLRLTGKKGNREIGEKVIDINAMEQWAESVEKWKKSEPQSYQCLVYPPEAMPLLMEVLGDLIATMPEESRISAADFPNGNFSCEGQNKFGYLGFDHSRPPTDEEVQIVIRFAREFERIYLRFLDLEKAEAQAREAIKQSSLDRVRGQISSMRSTEDLQRITPLIWHELEILGVPFIRCGLIIIDEAAFNVQVFLTTPVGNPLGALLLPMDFSVFIASVIAHWRKEIVYTENWSRQQFIAWTKSMLEYGQIKDPGIYQGAANPPESLYLHFVPFSQGMLYVGNVATLTEEKLSLVKSLAETFSVAYARYEDFSKLRIAKEEVEKALLDLKATQTQLIQSEKMASLGELAAGISHEIQNPLNFVNNFSEVSKELLDEMAAELDAGNQSLAMEILKDLKENLQKITLHGKRADAIVKGMLQHSQSSPGIKEPTDLNVVADEYFRLAYHGLRAKDKSFNALMETDFDPKIGKVNIIAQDISRVILNLITNAFYAVNEKKKETGPEYKPTVRLQTKRTTTGVEVRVTDNGNGIPEKIKVKIFQPFFTTKPSGQGTGLGLSMSYDIVTKAHGGEIKVETKESEGSTFIVYLPD